MITLNMLKQRRDSLSELETVLKTDLEMVKERSKHLRKELANTKGAIIEIDGLIESND